MTQQPPAADFPPLGGHDLRAYASGIGPRGTCGFEKYPAAIGVFCDNCHTEEVNDFVVSDQVTKAQRFEIARKHLRTVGWSCTAAGDYCPECATAQEG